MSAEPPVQQWQRAGYIISTDRARIDIDVVHGYLTRSYWAEGIPRDTVARAINASLNFGIYHEAAAPDVSDAATDAALAADNASHVGAQPVAPSPAAATVSHPAAAVHTPQVGGARIVTDYATFAYIADVFVLEDHRGKALGIWLMECVAAHPSLQGLRRWMLGTRDAHTLYQKTGFTPLAAPDRWMERAFPDIYNH